MVHIGSKSWWWIAVLWLLLISFLFLLPGSNLPPHPWLHYLQVDKLVHIFFFAVLIFLWRFNVRALAWLWVGGTIYAIAVEVAQHMLVKNREADVWDVVADLVGIGIGLKAWLWYREKNKPL